MAVGAGASGKDAAAAGEARAAAGPSWPGKPGPAMVACCSPGRAVLGNDEGARPPCCCPLSLSHPSPFAFASPRPRCPS